MVPINNPSDHRLPGDPLHGLARTRQDARESRAGGMAMDCAAGDVPWPLVKLWYINLHFFGETHYFYGNF